MKSEQFRSSKNSSVHLATSIFEIEHLETRFLLSVNLSDEISDEVDGYNLIENGSFEEGLLNDSGFYDSSEIPGWFSPDSSGAEIELRKMTRDGVPILALELDSRASNLDRVIQNVNTESGETYLLSFDIRSRAGNSEIETSELSNDLRVLWNREFVGRFQASQRWQNVSVKVVADSDTSQVAFHEISEQLAEFGDGVGPLIDNVRLTKFFEYSLENSDFETVNSERVLVDQMDVPGWVTSSESGNLKIVERDFALEGSKVLQLNADSSTEEVMTFSKVKAGNVYYIQFDAKGAGENGKDDFVLRFEDSFAGRFTAVQRWNKFGAFVKATADGAAKISFVEISEVANGPFIDNVRLFQLTSDSDGPELESTDPSQNAVVNSDFNAITFNFDEPISTDSLEDGIFELIWAGENGEFGDVNDREVDFEIVVNVTGKSISLVPDTLLEQGNYRASFDDQRLFDLVDNTFAQENNSLEFSVDDTATARFVTEDLSSNRFNGVPNDRLQVVVFYDGSVIDTPSLKIGLSNGTEIEIGGSNPGGDIDKFDTQIETREYRLNGLTPSGEFTISGVSADGVIDGLAFGLFWKDKFGQIRTFKSNSNAPTNVSNFVGIWPLGYTAQNFVDRTPQLSDSFARQGARGIIEGSQLLQNGSYEFEGFNG